MDRKRAATPLTLIDADICSRRVVSRRSMLSALGLGLGTAAAGIAGAIARPVRAAAQSRPGCTDGDTGRYEDAPGAGIRCRPGMQPTGCTDGDSGPSGDPIGYGTRCQPRATKRTGCTDNDSGPNEDQTGFGTRCWI
jgi:hypothetical protein